MNKPVRRSAFTSLLLLCAFAAFCESHADTPPPQHPNIIFLLADDLGNGDLHCYGHPYARTPNIDSLAKDGTRFMQFYATGSTCCPARAGLMTSKLPATYPVYPANGGFANHVTITELLKKEGYATGHFGKWHLGPVDIPSTYGIDCVQTTEVRPTNVTGKYIDPRGRDAWIYDAAIKFIEQHKESPFYLDVWGHISHYAVNPPDVLVQRWAGLKVKESDFPAQMLPKFDDARKSGGNVDDGMQRYMAEIESLDDGVGRLLKKLDELGLSSNTIVVFSSDQGADMTKITRGGLRFNMMGCNGPYRGGKATHWEGGVRVPWIVRWPGHVPAGRTDFQSVISGVDWLPTLCSITGVKINPSDFDGEDDSAAWLGKDPHVRTTPLFWKASNIGSEAYIRDGQWKLRYPTRLDDTDIELYDIIDDPAESKNVATQHPDIVKQLSTKLAAWNATLPKEYIKTGDKAD